MTPCPPWLGAGAEKEVAGGRRPGLDGSTTATRGRGQSTRVIPHSFSARVNPDGWNFVAVFICHQHFSLAEISGPEVIVEDMD